MTSPALDNIPDRTPDQARADIQRKDMASWWSPDGWCGSPYTIANSSCRIVASCDYESDRDALLQAARAHHALVEALNDCLIMIERLKRHARIEDNAGYTYDGRMLKLSDVEDAARAVIALARKGGGQ